MGGRQAGGLGKPARWGRRWSVSKALVLVLLPGCDRILGIGPLPPPGGGETSFASCNQAGAGRSDCGSGSESCCESLAVVGGEFVRNYDALRTPSVERFPATVSDFRLDKYEVTLGRFRAFVDAWVGGWRPSEGQGKHGHLHGGQGLALASGGHEFGWRSEWAKGVPVTKDAWDQALACDTAGSGPPGSGPPGSGPTNDAARRDKLPVRCVTWTEAMAFCLWDGGFLPSEAEWSYAAGGGSEQRTYPWLVSGRVPLGVSKNLAVYDATSAEVVGSRPEGAGRWGQLDLAGNASEWTADGDGAYPQPCIDCVNRAEAGGARVVRGGSFRSPAGELLATFRSSAPLMERSRTLGLRCSRGPEGKATGSDGGTDAGKERVGGGRDGG